MTTLLREILEGEDLTDREIEVLRWAAEGLTAAETGEKLFLACETVKGYRKRALAKTGTRTLAGAVAVAFRKGWIV